MAAAAARTYQKSHFIKLDRKIPKEEIYNLKLEKMPGFVENKFIDTILIHYEYITLPMRIENRKYYYTNILQNHYVINKSYF